MRHILTLEEHIKTIIFKVNKTIGQLNNRLPRSCLITIYKLFVRPHLDYIYVILDKTYNNSFHQRLESLQCRASLTITGTIKSSSINNLYHELGLESLQNRRQFRKLCVFCKIVKEQSPKYFFDLIPSNNNSYIQRDSFFSLVSALD